MSTRASHSRGTLISSSGSISDPYYSLKCQYSHEHWRKTVNTHYKSENYAVVQEATEEDHMYTASVMQNIYKTITENIPTSQ